MKGPGRTLILGAGISGLLAGKILSRAGQEVTILEKSRGVGGRMATRRFEAGVFDHGAQFFTVRDSRFRDWVNLWMQEGVARVWSGGFSNAGALPNKTGHPRYRGLTGMTSIAKYLAQGLDIQLQTRVELLSVDDGVWLAQSDDGKEFEGNHLILTAPVPQSLRLLEAGKVSLPKREKEQLQNLQYHPCIAVLALLDGSSAIPTPGGLRLDHGPIQWLGDNTQKGISPKANAVTLHASADFSDQNFDQVPEMLAEQLIRIAQPWLGSNVLDWQIHKWRYSQATQSYAEHFLEIPGSPPLFFVGDAFGAPRVEGAAISGIAVATHILSTVHR
jgi:predicted NAD/FAD-dependent oxidoreductase